MSLTCRVESLYRVVVNLQRGVGFAASEANNMIALIIEFDERITDDMVRQTDVVHHEHTAVHLYTTRVHHRHQQSTITDLIVHTTSPLAHPGFLREM